MNEPQKPQEIADSSRCSTIFASRDANLMLLGFATYADYLQSDLWSWIRTAVLDGMADSCECCGSTTGLCLHHRSYAMPVLVGNFSNCSRQIVRVCNECHVAIHKDGDVWFAMEVANERFEELVGRGLECRKGRSGPMNRSELFNGTLRQFDRFASGEF